MHNWDPSQPTNFEQNWYNNMFHQAIKQEHPPPASPPRHSPHLEHYLALKQQMLSAAMTPSPRAMDPNFNAGQTPTEVASQQFFDSSPVIMSQQQHALGFNPLTPPGLPNAVLPSMAQFYAHSQTLNPMNNHSVAEPKMQSTSSNALTPRNTPPMDVTPPKSPKPSHTSTSSEMDQDVSSNSSEDMKFIESEDDESIRMPIYNSHGKMKNHRCKHCGHLAITKVEFWEHARTHMKPEKTLQCFRCPFVTELKHHLEYHIRKHKNLKPFQCEKCSYTCVNKSMLNSHLKSHSSVYQYRCLDCDYATKYCHSFKLHLRKYEHKPGVVLDEDGSPNPSVVIDVYGTRRGPKSKSGRKEKSAASKMPQLNAALKGVAPNQQQQKRNVMPASPAKSTASSSSEFIFQSTQNNLINQQVEALKAQNELQQAHQQQQQQQQQAQQQAQQQQQHLQQNLQQQQIYLQPLTALIQQRNLSLLPYLNLNLQMMAAQQQAILAQLPPEIRQTVLYHFRMQTQPNADEEEKDDEEEEDEGSAIDLTTATPVRKSDTVNNCVMNLKVRENDQQKTTPLISSSNKSRRKGRVLKLDQPSSSRSSPPPAAPASPPPSSTPFVDPAKIFDSKQFQINLKPASNSNRASPTPNYSNYPFPPTVAIPGPIPEVLYECKYCDIFFRSAVIYTIHMGYHSCDDVFTCNMCGEKCENAVGLFIHMARNPHF